MERDTKGIGNADSQIEMRSQIYSTIGFRTLQSMRTSVSETEKGIASMNKLIAISLIVLANSVAMAALDANSDSNPVGCPIALVNPGGLKVDRAAQVCAQNSTKLFMSCQIALVNSSGLAPESAAAHCLENSSHQFVVCVISAVNSRGTPPEDAARSCSVEIAPGIGQNL
jgi:hypothetical protein